MKKLLIIFLLAGHWAFSQTTVLTQLESIAQNNPTSPSIFFNIGQYYFFNGKFMEATQQFDKAISLDNNDADFYFFQAVSYEAQGMVEKALDSYDKAIMTESSTEYIIRRGYLRHKLKKYVGAAKDFKEALETYEDMSDLKKLLQDCEKNGGTAGKDVETNTTTMKITPEQSSVFLERFLKYFEKLSDAGELYRGMLSFFTNNLDKAIPVFEQFIKKDSDAESMFFQAIAYELKNNTSMATTSYFNAIQEIDDEIVETSFEKLAGSPKATLDLMRLQHSKTDYQFALKKATQTTGYVVKPPVTTTDDLVKGEVRSATSLYTFVVEKQEGTTYQLVVRDKNMRKVMFSSVKAEKQGDAITVKIIWGEKKDEGGMTWAVRPQDVFTARYTPTNATYSQEGDRVKAAKNTNIDWNALTALHPTPLTFREALSYASRAFMVGYLIKE